MSILLHNPHSLICTYISQHENTWREDFKKLNIRCNEQEQNGHRYAIFNYQADCDFSDPIVQEARGIIIDLTNLQVVCWPFRKFGNYGESYADSIDWRTARVQDKEDGSICKLYYDPLAKRWQWATNSVMDAANAPLAYSYGSVHTFLDAIHRAENYGVLMEAINQDQLNPRNTYIFELTGPYNKVVIQYPQESLWHIGTRNNETGQEMISFIGIHRPQQYPLHSLSDCIQAAKNLNKDDKNVEKEGFVVVDQNWHRIKVKSPTYLAMHYARSYPVKKEAAVEYLLCGGDPNNAKSLEDKVRICETQYKMALLELEVQKYIDYVRAVDEEMSHDRKAVATTIKDDKYASFGFQALKSKDLTAANLLFDQENMHSRKRLLRLLDEVA